MKYWEQDDFKALRRQWSKKLKKSGFKDIEMSNGELVRYSFHLTDAFQSGTYDYYLKANEFLNTHQFKTECDKFIWQNHADGLSCRKISALLAAHPIYPALTYPTIANRIRSMETIMLKKTEKSA